MEEDDVCPSNPQTPEETIVCSLNPQTPEEEIEYSLNPETIPMLVPSINDEFETFELVQKFYKEYAAAMRFKIKKRSVDLYPGTNVIRWEKLSCSREGVNMSKQPKKAKPRRTIRTNCKASIWVVLTTHFKYRISQVTLEHNHNFATPSKDNFFTRREIDSHVKRQLDINDRAGIRPHKSLEALAVEYGGYGNLPFTERDLRNELGALRKLRLGEEDASALLKYLIQKQKENTGFWYNIDLNEEGRLSNVFWSDGRCREACKEFGDVISFDATFLTNKYDMPFAPFVRINHHGQSILLGCGLLADQTIQTFVWLFTQWLECISVPSKGIVTDQCASIRAAIEIVFPNTIHRLCIWHLMKKLPTNLNQKYPKYKRMSYKIRTIMYGSQYIHEFEERWSKLITKYKLEEHEWLNSLYRMRERWVPCYLKDMFWAGMSYTQRSESMNAFFDGFLNAKTSLKQFVEQFDQALRYKIEKENFQDFLRQTSNINEIYGLKMEHQLQLLYTFGKFREVQEEFGLIGGLRKEIKVDEGNVEGIIKYKIDEAVSFVDDYEEKHFTQSCFYVTFNEKELDVMCSCRNIEFKLIPCRHMLSVLIQHGVQLLPDKYIVNRWRHDVVRPYKMVKLNYVGYVSTPEAKRYSSLCQIFIWIAELASRNDERVKKCEEWGHEVIKEMTMETEDLTCGLSPTMEMDDSESDDEQNILDPKEKKHRGAKRKNKMKSCTEKKPRKSSNKGKQVDKNPPSQNEDELEFPTQERSPPSFPHQPPPLLMGASTTSTSSHFQDCHPNQFGMHDVPSMMQGTPSMMQMMQETPSSMKLMQGSESMMPMMQVSHSMIPMMQHQPYMMSMMQRPPSMMQHPPSMMQMMQRPPSMMHDQDLISDGLH